MGGMFANCQSATGVSEKRNLEWGREGNRMTGPVRTGDWAPEDSFWARDHYSGM